MHSLRIYLLLVMLFIAGCSLLKAQFVISPEVIIGDENQVQLLVTKQGDQWLGYCTELHNNKLLFKARDRRLALTFYLSELSFLDLAAGTHPMMKEIAYENRPKKVIDYEKFKIPTNQLFYSATAIPYEGKGTYRNTMFLVNDVNLRIGDHVGFSAAVTIPYVASLRLQTHFKVAQNIHLGAAVHYHDILFEEDYDLHPYVIATIGNRRFYVNITAGNWIDREINRIDSNRQITYTCLNLGASYHFHSQWRVSFEAMRLKRHRRNQTFSVPTIQFSYLHKRSMIDFGLISSSDINLTPIPVVSYTHLL